MNVQLNTFIRFSGPAEDLLPLIEGISALVVEHGYGCVDDHLNALIVLRESDVGSFVQPVDFAKNAIDGSIYFTTPGMEEVNDTGN